MKNKFKKPSHHDLLKAKQEAKRLRKKDKRAAAILLALLPFQVVATGFGRDREGRYCYEWRCSYEYDEWDSVPALDYLEEYCGHIHFGECIDTATGDLLPDDEWPAATPSPMVKLPQGWRWRGKNLVPVDKHGAMVKAQ